MGAVKIEQGKKILRNGRAGMPPFTLNIKPTKSVNRWNRDGDGFLTEQ